MLPKKAASAVSLLAMGRGDGLFDYPLPIPADTAYDELADRAMMADAVRRMIDFPEHVPDVDTRATARWQRQVLRRPRQKSHRSIQSVSVADDGIGGFPGRDSAARDTPQLYGHA